MPPVTKVLIAAGGTGGHLYPAIVLGRELARRGCEVAFVSRRNAMAEKIFKQENLSFHEIPAAPFLGQTPARLARNAWTNWTAVRAAREILRREKPDAVAGFGAYISVPVVVAAKLQGIPVVLHEQNPEPGLATRFCALFARKVAVSFPETAASFGSKAVVTGNLVRGEIYSRTRSDAIKDLGLSPFKKTVLVTGGSAGAKSINAAVIQALEKLKERGDQLQFLHLSGSAEETSRLVNAYARAGVQAQVTDFHPDMGRLYACADVAVCRAGATTLSELIVVRVPALLVPYPHAGDHQANNAGILLELGAARMLRESPQLGAQLGDKLARLLESSGELESMRLAYENFPVDLRQSAARLADLVLETARTS